jgi:hypothetical protein
MRLYLSGPMTGLPLFNFPKFHEYALILRHRGHVVTNPAENFDGRQDLPRWMYLELAYEQVPKSDAVAVLPGWGASMGAWGEIRIARDLNLPILDADTLEPSPLFGEALEVSDRALACIGTIMEGGRKKHPAYTWAHEHEDEHIRKSIRHALSYELQRDGQSLKDHEDHLSLAACRMVLALARRDRPCDRKPSDSSATPTAAASGV